MTMMAIWMLGFASLLAQAEPAPPEPDPGSAPSAASPAPAAPAATPAPSGPAEPAPAAPPAPEPPEPPRPLRFTISLLGGFAYRLGTGGPSGLGPALGFSLGGSFERRYATPAPGLELGAAVDFLYDQFSQGFAGAADNSNRTFTDTTFAALQTLGVRVAQARLWCAAGGGLDVGYFSPEASLGAASAVAYLPFARGVAGIDVALNDQVALGVRASYTFMLTDPTTTTTAGQTLHLFGDLLDIHAGLFYRFQ